MKLPIANDSIMALHPYQPGAPISEIARKYGIPEDKICKLASNESPYGPSRNVLDAISAIDKLQLYPDQYQLIQELARHHDVDADQIILGNGSNDILDLIARVYLDKDSEAIAYEHSFLVYKLASCATGARFVETRARDYGYDLDEMLRAVNEKTRVIWIDNPNNPTGTFIDHEKIRDFLAKVPMRVLVVLDEAYWDYLPDNLRTDTIGLTEEFPNLIITRTFSKIHGLAALRIGYAIGHTSIVEPLNRLRQPFNVNSLGIVAATASLGDTGHIGYVRERTLRSREQIVLGIEQLGLTHIPSFTNFITVCVKDSARIYELLLARGVIVRPIANYGLDNYLRITIGTEEENAILLTALKECL